MKEDEFNPEKDYVMPDTTGALASEQMIQTYIESPPPEASEHIFSLLKTEAKTWIAKGYPTTSPPPLVSPFAQEIIELENMPDGDEKTENENKQIQKIRKKLELAGSIANKLRPASYSIGIGFPFGMSISFTWSRDTRQ